MGPGGLGNEKPRDRHAPARRSGGHAEMTGLSESDLFAELVKAGCKRFVVSDRAQVPGEAAEADAT
jgi:hypothetical protein